MIGSGSMLHAIASLKANKRERKHFAAAEIKNSIYTDPIVFKKSSKEMCIKTAKRVQILKTRENIRLGLVMITLFSFVTSLLIML
jgi:hypothetical protein